MNAVSWMMTIHKVVYLYFRGACVTNMASNAPPAKPESAAETWQIVLKEIGAKWSKFSEQDLSALKSKDAVVAAVVAKYGLEKAQAQRDVEFLMKGRCLTRNLHSIAPRPRS
jgi:hypothetical protein